MGPVRSVGDFIDMLRRRIWVILAVIVIGCGLSVMAALQETHMYRSTEVIQLVQPQINGDTTTQEGAAARRLQLIEQRLMARDSVLGIIDQFGLFADMPALTAAERVTLLRQSVRIDGLSGNRVGGQEGWVSVVTVTAEMSSPLQAQQVAHEIARRTIELSNENRLKQARETLAFYTARVETLREQINRTDDALAGFRKDNDLALPGTLEIRRSEITSINEELLSIARERIRIERAADQARQTQRQATAERMQADFNAQLTTLEAQAKLLRDRKAELESSLQTSPQIEQRIGSYDQELEQLRTQLETASGHRTEAEVAYRMETQAQGERLTVLEPATVPDYPFTGSRKKLAVMGAMASLMAGLGAAFLLELRNPVMRTAAHMERDLGIRPVVAVPFLDTGRKRGRRSFFGKRTA